MVKKKEEEEEELPIYEIWSPAKLAQILGGLGPTLLELHERCKYGAIAGCTFLRETICRTADKSFDSPYPYVWDAFRTALAQARLLTISKDLAALHREYGERIKAVERDYFELPPRERAITSLSTLIMEEIPELMDAIDEFKENVTLYVAHIGGTTTYKASHIDNLTKEEIKKSKEIAKELYMAEVEGRPLKIEPVVKPPPKKPPKKIPEEVEEEEEVVPTEEEARREILERMRRLMR